jgi:stalled ribosome rescue protein Dom34
MRRIGIWLDKKNAHIVEIHDDRVSLNTILSEVEDFNIHGGSGTKFKGGPQDVVQDSRYLEREKQQLKKYFKNIVSAIKDAEDLVIFGPAETGEKFYKELTESYSDIKAKVKDVVKTDSMTKNQVKAWVKEFFNIPIRVKGF